MGYSKIYERVWLEDHEELEDGYYDIIIIKESVSKLESCEVVRDKKASLQKEFMWAKDGNNLETSQINFMLQKTHEKLNEYLSNVDERLIRLEGLLGE